MTVSSSDNGKELTVCKGGLIRLTLPSEAGTGYLWRVELLDPDFLEVVDHEAKGVSLPGVTGGPVSHTWNLRSRRAGLTELRMIYARPWEENEKSGETFAVRLRIVP